jgi:hypothetical protein
MSLVDSRPQPSELSLSASQRVCGSQIRLKSRWMLQIPPAQVQQLPAKSSQAIVTALVGSTPSVAVVPACGVCFDSEFCCRPSCIELSYQNPQATMSESQPVVDPELPLRLRHAAGNCHAFHGALKHRIRDRALAIRPRQHAPEARAPARSGSIDSIERLGNPAKAVAAADCIVERLLHSVIAHYGTKVNKGAGNGGHRNACCHRAVLGSKDASPMDEEVADGSGSGVWDGELNQPSFTADDAAATFRAMKPVQTVQASSCPM